jgi:copper oxidase (laccase) domain-containing protein
MIAQDQPTIFDSQKIIAAVSSKIDGNVKYEQGDDAEGNIERFIAHVGITSAQLVVMYVNDPDSWDEIKEITLADTDRGGHHPDTRIHADAFITNTPGVALLLPTADCNAVIINDPVQNVVALVHLGWQSTVNDLVHKVVNMGASLTTC